MIRTLLFLTPLLFALPALAQTSPDAFTNCAGTEVTSTSVSASGFLCYEFDSGQGTGGTAGWSVKPNARAKVCLDPDRNASGSSGAAVVDIEVCPSPGDASDNTCLSTGVADLTLSGSNPCAAVVQGRWRFNVTTAPTGTEDAVLDIRGY